jgi:aryl-alcohol dehydrogenase-like predicted oxidoreductase
MKVLTKTIQGQTLHYTRLALGLAALGRPGYMNLGHADDLPAERTQQAMLEHALAVMDEAWVLGIRWFDAARSYGLAEDFLQIWLRTRNIDPEQVTISSKWGYTYTANWQVHAEHHEVKDLSLATLRRQIAESSYRLGNWLGLYQIHSATLESGVLDNDAVLDELARIRDGGMIMGLSVTGVYQSATIEKAMTVQRGGQPLFGSVQATWNLYEQSAGDALRAAHDAGWLVIIKEALANGRLTERGQTADSELRRFCESTHQTMDAVAVACVLHQPFVDVALSGAASTAHLRSNVQALSATPLPSLKMMIEPAEQYWNERSSLQWN